MTPIVTTLQASSPTRGRVRGVAPSGGGYVAPDWERLRNFNTGTLGAPADLNTSGFSIDGDDSVFSDEQVYEGTQSGKVQKLPDGTDGTGDYGGTITFSGLSNCFQGDTLWIQWAVYFPTAAFNLETARTTGSKFIRYRSLTAADGNAGFGDLYFNDQGGDAMLNFLKEPFPSNDGFIPMGLWADLTQDTWHLFTWAVRLDSVKGNAGGTSRLRVWRNTDLLIDRDDVKTLTTATDYVTNVRFFSTWNDGGAVDASCFIDDIKIAKNGVPTWALSLEGVV
jgi:hypothetical protein